MADDGFDDVQFPTDISRGAVGGAKFSTTITITTSGYEQRNENWSQRRGEWDVSHGLKTMDQMYALIEFFHARRGALRSFRFKDWSDYKQTMDSGDARMLFATGDDTVGPFQLKKTYTDTGSFTYDRDITKPISGTVQIWVNSSLQEETTDYTIAYNTGLVTFEVGSEPTSGHLIEWKGEFDTHVRFDIDHQQVEVEVHDLHNWPATIVEVRG